MTDGSVRFCGCGFVVLWFLRKIRLTQLWVELSWDVATKLKTLLRILVTVELLSYCI